MSRLKSKIKIAVYQNSYVSRVTSSDESEPSWLELNNFQLGSAWLVTFSIQLGNFTIKARKLA